jgi:uncharacterized membrane protein
MMMRATRENMAIWISLAVSITTKLAFLTRKSLWIDEALASGICGMGPGELMSKVTAGTPHPPLAFFVIRISVLLFGSGEFGLRLLIALMVASATIPVYRLVQRRIGSRPAFWTAIIWAVSPFSVSLGQEAWVYGINVALTFWLVDFADLAWRGSRRALTGFLITGIAGILTTHLFIFSILAAGTLYLTLPRDERTSWKVPAVSTGLLFLTYIPVFLFFVEQFLARGRRMAAGQTRTSFLLRAPSEFFRLLADGLLPDISRNLLDRPRMIAAYILNGAVILWVVIRALIDGAIDLRQRLWFGLILILPFALFIRDDPTIRQLALVWVPFCLMAASAFEKYRWSGPAVTFLCLIALVPYYSSTSFPYHPSDWRSGVATVESLADEHDVVLVVGGKSTGLAWDYYSSGMLQRVAPGGETPFAGEGERSPSNPAIALDSLLDCDHTVWILLDRWGENSVTGLAGDNLTGTIIRISPCMEIGRISRYE